MTTTNRQPRKRGQYGTQAPDRFAAPSAGFVPAKLPDRAVTQRPEGPVTHRVRVADHVGKVPGVPGSGRNAVFVLRYDSGSLWIRKSRWTEINEAEFERLRHETVQVGGWTDHEGRHWRKVRNRFTFEQIVDGGWQPVNLPEPDDVLAGGEDEAA